MKTGAEERFVDETPSLKTQQAQEPVYSFCVDTWSSPKVSLLPDQLAEFVRCDLITEAQTVAEADRVLTLVSQVLKPKSEISGSGELKAGARMFRDKTTALVANTNGTVSKVWSALEATQMRPCHILHFMSILF